MTGRAAAFGDIANLKGRYFRIIDTKQFHELDHILTADAFFDIEGIVTRYADGTIAVPPGLDALFPGEQRAIVKGKGPMMDFIAGALGPVISIHHGFTPEIEVKGNRAKAVWPMEDMFFECTPPHRKIRHGYGHYVDDYRKEDGDWRIAGQTLSFLHQQWF